jgi:hypothetical protein
MIIRKALLQDSESVGEKNLMGISLEHLQLKGSQGE